ncbi:hypothetical protein [Paraburkholderia sp.]|jgi:hypothetical protein|uniref:hypothetical protein n=1 Tax=Paraburkholderia sp. TaxID=1926495 RepID=UPI002F40591A
MNAPAGNVLGMRIAVEHIAIERAVHEQRSGNVLHRLVVVVANLGLTILEGPLVALR